MSPIKELTDAFCEELLDLHRLMIEAEEQCRKITQERDELQIELAQARAENERLKVDIGAATRNASELRLRVLELTGEKKVLQEELGESRQCLADTHLTAEKLQAELDQAYSRLRVFERHLTNSKLVEQDMPELITSESIKRWPDITK